MLSAAGVSVFGTIVYDLLASSELAPWSDRMELEMESVQDEDQTTEDKEQTSEIWERTVQTD